MAPPESHRAPRLLLVGLLAALSGAALAPARVKAQEPIERSRLWDGLRYPAAGAYHDLVARAELSLSTQANYASDRAAAERALEAAIRQSPGRPQAFYVLGRLRAAEGRHGAAANAFDKARRLDPQYLPRTLGYAFGMAALRAGRHVAAAQAIRVLVRPADPPRLASTLLGNAATAYLAAGHLKAALGLFQQAITRDPAYAPPRWGLAVATHRSDLPELASRLARAALLVDPGARFLRSEQALYVPPACRRYHEALAWEALDAPERAREAWQAYLSEAGRSPWRSQAERALTRLARLARPRGPAAPPTTPRRASGGSARPPAPRGRQ